MAAGLPGDEGLQGGLGGLSLNGALELQPAGRVTSEAKMTVKGHWLMENIEWMDVNGC